jgi:hypothetical protein
VGDALRVVVQEATAERVVLQVVPRDAPPPAVTPARGVRAGPARRAWRRA